MSTKKRCCGLPSGGAGSSFNSPYFLHCSIPSSFHVLILSINHSQVISKKDQAQYWCHADIPYQYVSVNQFIEMFKASNLGQTLAEELSKPYDKSWCPNSALSFSIYSSRKWELFKACMARELLLMKRNTFVYVFKTAQVRIHSNG